MVGLLKVDMMYMKNLRPLITYGASKIIALFYHSFNTSIEAFCVLRDSASIFPRWIERSDKSWFPSVALRDVAPSFIRAYDRMCFVICHRAFISTELMSLPLKGFATLKTYVVSFLRDCFALNRTKTATINCAWKDIKHRSTLLTLNLFSSSAPVRVCLPCSCLAPLVITIGGAEIMLLDKRWKLQDLGRACIAFHNDFIGHGDLLSLRRNYIVQKGGCQ